ncbi:MAG TPA: COX15/CtaA family protein [Gemmatimonadales bacterium]|nr:COX15/CtaA family protein [Gemmatimonadales bacterium]
MTTRGFARLAWVAAVCAYLLIVLGAMVRITGSGMGCGDHWPLCNGRLFPPLDDLGTLIEWTHRLAAAVVSILVIALAGYAWLLRRDASNGPIASRPLPPPAVSYRLLPPLTAPYRPWGAAYVALTLLVLQVGLGAITVKLALPPWTVIVHLGTAMLLLATLIVAAQGPSLTPGASPGMAGAPASGAPRSRAGQWASARLWASALGFVTVLLGALTANLGAASACLGFPLCNGQIIPEGNYLQHIHWTHRVLAYGLAIYVLVWASRTPARGPKLVLVLVMLQVGVAAAMVLLALPPPLQAVHVAVGTAVWAGLVAVRGGRSGKGR